MEEINTIRGPDFANPQYFSPIRPEPTLQRLNAPSTRVWVQNTSPNQNHIVIDRFNVGHELRPGERREMEMVNDEIANLMEHRRPGRMYPEIDPQNPQGKMKPLHPILIEGMPELSSKPEPELKRNRG
jgi:hypothetical protein